MCVKKWQMSEVWIVCDLDDFFFFFSSKAWPQVTEGFDNVCDIAISTVYLLLT